MSIPKEPRQLMINLMYLVLTALLALNVSAEVMNAFFMINKGITNSNNIVETTNQAIMANIEAQVKAYNNEQNQAYMAKAKEAKLASDELVKYIDGLKAELFEKAGGPSEKDPDKPKRDKDKDITTRMLVGLENKKGIGYELQDRVIATRNKMLEQVDNDQTIASSLPLKIDEEGYKKAKKKDWVYYNFQQMPVAAVFPIMTKIQNDAKASATTIMNSLLNKISGQEVKFDAFQPVISATKGYVIKGEKYEAEVFLSAYSTTNSDNTKIYVGGSPLAVEEGKAKYTASTSTIGTKKYSVRIDVINPLTQEVKQYEKEFEYEVGERSVTVSADKMNVFYIGVDNPISVSAAGISSNDLKVSINGGGGTLSKTGSANYNVQVNTPTDDCRINVSGGGLSDSKLFRVKRIPDPVARLGNKEDGSMGNGEFKAQPGLIAWLDNFDFNAKCDIQGFKLVRVPKRQDPIEVLNSGGRYAADAKRIVDAAKPGDTYYFNEVKARCPGDKAGRKINSLVFQIK
ncbi:MAG: gliding motility protein GldM [Saprospirales bacterium]|jgi:gliding motility-associated protein GldM|nr:gliding motility protein GldM [Saprospirales bacterium]MBK6902512.1 gliding motility protein GldM [Saprospirales bacterium]